MLLPRCQTVHEICFFLLTPADADEHPLAQLVGGVGEDDGGVEVAALSEHPEEVGGVEIVEGGGDESTPNLRNKSSHLTFYSFLNVQLIILPSSIFMLQVLQVVIM